jgi:hypothetical protein
MSIPMVSVIYEEWQPETYEGILIRLGNTEEIINTGNFMSDWITVQQKYPEFHVTGSLNNFMNDFFGVNLS